MLLSAAGAGGVADLTLTVDGGLVVALGCLVAAVEGLLLTPTKRSATLISTAPYFDASTHVQVYTALGHQISELYSRLPCFTSTGQMHAAMVINGQLV